jgi:hypothetical protein
MWGNLKEKEAHQSRRWPPHLCFCVAALSSLHPSVAIFLVPGAACVHELELVRASAKSSSSLSSQAERHGGAGRRLLWGTRAGRRFLLADGLEFGREDGWRELQRLQGGAAQVQVPLLPHALVSPATILICRCAWLHTYICSRQVQLWGVACFVSGSISVELTVVNSYPCDCICSISSLRRGQVD